MMTTKINISLPDEVLKEIEQGAKTRHTTRSGFIREAAIAYVETLRRAEAEAKLKRQRQKAADTQDRIREAAGSYDAAGELRKWRDSRK